MYRNLKQPSTTPENFELTPGSKLSPDNRWVIMASLIPIDEFEEEYAKLFDPEKGAPAKSFRLALGTLIIKEKLGISDRETCLTNQREPLSTILYRIKFLSTRASNRCFNVSPL